MMRVLALEGQRGAAIAQYEKCRRVLAEELGVEPSSETRALYESILAGNLEPEVAGGRAPRPGCIQPAVSQPPNLPTQLTPFIGRERELADLRRLVADPACRCMTLVGPGGIGKTRLALETASQMQAVFANGVYFVPLAPVTTTQLIVPVIADAIRVYISKRRSRRRRKHSCSATCRNKQALLLWIVSSICWPSQGIEVLAALLELLAHAPQVKLLITSRESMGLPGEWVFEVQGLPLPEGGGTEDGGALAQNAIGGVVPATCAAGARRIRPRRQRITRHCPHLPTGGWDAAGH